ncbi:MAG: hypothetical protein ACE5GE_07870 [Phycisphaerae bacterium]
MKHLLILSMGCTGLLFAASAQGDDRTATSIAPPDRPLPVSLAQFQALQRLSAQPDHAWVADTSAAYSPERARDMTEAGVVATQLVVPASILLFLAMAAPL